MAKTPPTTTTGTTIPAKKSSGSDAIAAEIKTLIQAGGGSERGYLGNIPDDYVVRRQRPGPYLPGQGIEEIKPRYSEGDQYRPAQNSWDQDEIADLQYRMYRAGLYGPNKPTPGVWDSLSAERYEELLGMANQNGVDATEMLSHLEENPMMSEEEREPFKLKLTNTDDLEAVIQEAARSKTGRTLPPDKVARLAAAYNAEERREQESAYSVNQSGGQAYDAPSEEVFFANQIESEDPLGSETYAFKKNMDVFQNLLNSIGGQGVSTGGSN